jgi:FixJ family two-component response regulator
MRSQIFLIENNDCERTLVGRLLRENGYFVSEYDSVLSFVHGIDYESLQSGACVLSDMTMPDISGPELLNVLAADGVSLPVVFTTAHPDVQVAVNTMRYGASYVIQKPFAEQDLLATIMMVIAEFYAPELKQCRQPAYAGASPVVRRLESLSPRQREILTHVYAGELNKAIAKKLGISVKTVELHRARMMQKMRAESLIELIKMTAPFSNLLYQT